MWCHKATMALMWLIDFDMKSISLHWQVQIINAQNVGQPQVVYPSIPCRLTTGHFSTNEKRLAWISANRTRGQTHHSLRWWYALGAISMRPFRFEVCAKACVCHLPSSDYYNVTKWGSPLPLVVIIIAYMWACVLCMYVSCVVYECIMYHVYACMYFWTFVSLVSQNLSS